jgi:ABC-2 type transport system ATP-binding protein
VIEITDLYKYYGERRAIGPLTCSIQAGEIVGLLGLNGAGKTTTLRILACDLLPSSGTVLVDGLDVAQYPHQVRGRIGYLPDLPPLYGEMTVRAYLSFAARLRGLSRADADRSVAEIAEMTHIETVFADPIASLSHGFKQRVGIAQALVHRPRLLILDEPITGLDPVQIVEMRELLRSLRGAHTILLSSHILSEISETCDRILVIQDGQIAAAGTEAELVGALHGSVRCVVTARGDEARVRQVVEKIEGVQSVRLLPAAEAGDNIVTVQVDSQADLRPEVCRTLVMAGIPVLEIGAEARELELVFLELAKHDVGNEKHRGDRVSKPTASRPKGGDGAAATVEKGDPG